MSRRHVQALHSELSTKEPMIDGRIDSSMKFDVPVGTPQSRQDFCYGRDEAYALIVGRN